MGQQSGTGVTILDSSACEIDADQDTKIITSWLIHYQS